MLQSYHQNAEQFEIMFNKTKYDALPAKMKAIIDNAVEAASADMSWKAIDRYSKDYIEMQQKQNVKFYKTPDAVLQTQLTAYDAAAAKKSGENALFKEIEASQKAFAERAVHWDLDTNVSRRMAYNHYFGEGGRRPRRRPERRIAARRQPSGRSRVVFFCAVAHAPRRVTAVQADRHATLPAHRRQDQHLRRPGVLVADRRRSRCRSRGRCSPATRSTRRTRGRST